MDVTVIVWLVVGLVIFVLSFLLPKRKEELDEDTKKFAGEQIRDILNKVRRRSVGDNRGVLFPDGAGIRKADKRKDNGY